MALHNLVLEAKRHYYPFLLAHGFRWDTDEFKPESLYQMTGMYLVRHLRKIAAKKESSAGEVLESVIGNIVQNRGKDLFGTSDGLLGFADVLRQGDDVKLEVGLTNVCLYLKRFGTCVGIKVTDSRGDVHKDATEVLEQIASQATGEGGLDCFRPFVCRRSVMVPRWQAYGKNNIDINTELISSARYVPDVTWRTDSVVVAKALREDYISSDHQYGSEGGVEVGRYHDIPIYAQIIFGRKETDRTWRRGAITCGGAVLHFDSISGSCPDIRYFVQIADGNHTFKKSELGIDYTREQSCHDDLAQVLLEAFSARDLAETIARNPPWVAWRREVEKHPQKSSR